MTLYGVQQRKKVDTKTTVILRVRIRARHMIAGFERRKRISIYVKGMKKVS